MLQSSVPPYVCWSCSLVTAMGLSPDVGCSTARTSAMCQTVAYSLELPDQDAVASRLQIEVNSEGFQNDESPLMGASSGVSSGSTEGTAEEKIFTFYE